MVVVVMMRRRLLVAVVLFSHMKALESGGGGFIFGCLPTTAQPSHKKATSQKGRRPRQEHLSFPAFPRWPLSECIHRLGVFPPLASLALPFTH